MYTKGESSASLVPPSQIDPAFSGLVTAAYPHTLVAKLEAARRANDRVLLSFAGNSELYRDANGFNFEVWKQRVDKFRGIDISSYQEGSGQTHTYNALTRERPSGPQGARVEANVILIAHPESRRLGSRRAITP